MFGQYGILENQSKPYAELYMVDVRANDFTPGGVKKQTFDGPVQPGQVGLGALFNLLGDSKSLTAKFGIDHLNTGRLLYILLNGEEPKSLLNFRDFNTGSHYTINLIQAEYGTENQVSASFHIDMKITSASGSTKHFIVGIPNYRRKNVKNYRIKQITLSPDEKSVIFLIEKEEKDTAGSNIRYMVETVKIK
jgi:predicted secreted protein